MGPDLLLLRYGEIGIKSPPIRRRFEQALQENIERAFESQGLDCIISRLCGRIMVHSSDLVAASAIVRRIFGIVSFSHVRVRSSRLDELLPEVASFFAELSARRPDASSFAIRARRAGSHAYTSQDLARDAGGAVLDSPAGQRFHVDLEEPDIELFVEVRDDKAYLYSDTIAGPGGLPMGTQGRVLVLLKDVHSLVAAWLMLKRGCTIVPVHFEGVTGRPEQADAFERVLRAWNFRGHLIRVPHQETTTFPKDATCPLCMRQMVRKAGQLARYKKCKAIVTGEAFSSSTIDNLAALGAASEIPVLRPILGTTPELVAQFLSAMDLPAAATLPFSEPCPLRRPGHVPEERIVELETQLGLPAIAMQAVRDRTQGTAGDA